MIKTKLKRITVPAIYATALLVFGTSMYLVQRVVNTQKFETNGEMEYVDKEIVTDNIYVPVVVQTNIIARPYYNGAVTINKTFYDYNKTAEEQENSIIFYENTYMQNSGIDYSSDIVFDVVSILDGTVIDVKNDNVMGTIVEIRHTNELISVYQSLSEVTVKVDDKVVQGQVIGKSGKSNLNVDIENGLHFELYYMGEIVNPASYYDKSLTDL